MKAQQRPVQKVLLDGVYDAKSPLSMLRGCQHITKRIWQMLTWYWTALGLEGLTLEEVARL